MDKTATALAAAALLALGIIGYAIKDHPSVTYHLDRFCPALCADR